ncbi:DUF4880 domain-containing protein [Pseudomonas qingdaonensis]|nr:DUF4880 domain-containing protein [Pseudomonas qingdaonensis]
MSNDREAQRQALKEAARWHVQRMAGDASPGLERAWRAWLDSAPQNGWAWAGSSSCMGNWPVCRVGWRSMPSSVPKPMA